MPFRICSESCPIADPLAAVFFCRASGAFVEYGIERRESEQATVRAVPGVMLRASTSYPTASRTAAHPVCVLLTGAAFESA